MTPRSMGKNYVDSDSCGKLPYMELSQSQAIPMDKLPYGSFSLSTTTLRSLLWLWSALLGMASMWIVFEQDIYWQIRAGTELWQTWHWPTQDEWSYSASGQTWINVQWLATLLFSAIYHVGAEPALSLARVVLITLLLGMAGEILLQGVQTPANSKVPSPPIWLQGITILSTLPTLYLILWPRFQLRSDTLVLLIYTLLIWWSHKEPHRVTSNHRLGLMCIVLAANLHSGTAPFVVLAYVSLLLASEQTHRQKAKMTVLALMAFFLQPYPIACLPHLWHHIRYNSYNLIPNLDHQPLHAAYIHWQLGGWPGLAWLGICMMCFVYFLLARRHHWQMPKYWHQGREACWPMVLAVVLLTCMSINRIRVIPYQIFFLLPLLATSLRYWPPWLAGLHGTLSHTGAYLFLQSLTILWGFGVHEGLFPKQSAAFLAEHHPKGNIYHTFAMGSYIVWPLRNYRMYVDARETMYVHLQQEIIASTYDAKQTGLLLQKYHINTVLIPTPASRLLPDGTLIDALEEFFPKATWALVAFDHASCVLVRRIPAHQSLIDRFEYQILQPNIPPNWYPLRAEHTPETDQRFMRELEQCQQQSPDNVYCSIARASWLRTQSQEQSAPTAVALLEKSQLVAKRWNSPHQMTLVVELAAAYKKIGRPDKAYALEASLGQGMHKTIPKQANLLHSHDTSARP